MSRTRVFVSRRSQQPKLDDVDVVSSLAISPCEGDLRFLQRMFDDPDWNLFTAHTYQDGMAQLDRELIPVVICESQLPDGSWKDVLSRLALITDTPRLIVASRQADERLWSDVLRLGAFDLLAIPFREVEVGYAVGSAWFDWKYIRGQHNTEPCPVLAAPSRSTGPTPKETILVLDDDRANRMVISAVLQSNGYRVMEAACGEEAIRICKNRDVTLDLLVADVQLPDVSGTDVAVELMESCPDSAVLFISGTPMAGWTRAELECLQGLPPESVDFLEKPFTPSTLEEKVRQLVTRQARIKSQQLRPFEYIGWPHGRKH